MATYTTAVHSICENIAGISHQASAGEIEGVIEKSYQQIFTNAWPIWEESYRTELCKKILRHYWTREIGFETVGLWLFNLRTTMAEIMPYYNKLYEVTMSIEEHPYDDVDLERNRIFEESGKENGSETADYSKNGKDDITGNEKRVGANDSTTTVTDDTTVTGTSSGTGTDKRTTSGTNHSSQNFTEMYSDTPQGAITNVAAGTYLTNATIDNTANDGTKSETVDGNTTDSTNTKTISENDKKTIEEQDETVTTNRTDTKEWNEGGDSNAEMEKNRQTTGSSIATERGKSGGKSYIELMTEYRDSILNIDMLIIKELESLFMLIWD